MPTRQKGQPPEKAQVFRAPGKALPAHSVFSITGQGGQGTGVLSGSTLVNGFQDPESVSSREDSEQKH